jgi:hypothetical protein
MWELPTDPEGAALFVWWASLVLGLVVALVVAYLLWLIQRTAGEIETVVSAIWDTGRRVANNTIHIPILYRINTAAAKILGTAVLIKNGAAAIEAHARGCPGCPQCMLSH